MALPSVLDLAATTLRLQKGDFANNIFFSNVLTARLKQRGSVTDEQGGLQCDESLAYMANSNFGSYSGYDTLSVDPQTEFTYASYNWKELAGTIPISQRELDINRGKSQIKKLIDLKRRNAIQSASMILEDMLYGNGTGNGSKNILGLLAIAPIDPTADTLGGLSSSGLTWWRSKMAYDADSTYTSGADTAISFASAGIPLMQKMFLECSFGPGMETPDTFLTDADTYTRFERQFLDKVRYQDEKLANLGFTGLSWKGGMVTWTDRIGATAKTIAADGVEVSFPVAGSMYFLNTKHLFLRTQKNWDVGEFMEPVNQTAYAAKVRFMGQLTTDCRRLMGSIYHFID